MVADPGQTNAEVGAQLFLSARTVERHLGKCFTEPGRGSCRELHRALSALGHLRPAGRCGSVG